MKTAELKNKIITQLRFHRVSGKHEDLTADHIIEIMQSNLWTSPCICTPDEKTGEMLCCNLCGKPTARTTSKELPSVHSVIESRIKHFESISHTYEANELKLALDTIVRLIPPVMFKISGSDELASRDARIRELEEENKKLSRSIKFCKASINGALYGLQLDNTCDVIEKSTVIEQLNEELKILTPPKN